MFTLARPLYPVKGEVMQDKEVRAQRKDWDDLTRTAQSAIMKKYRDDYHCSRCQGKLYFSEGVTRVEHHELCPVPAVFYRMRVAAALARGWDFLHSPSDQRCGICGHVCGYRRGWDFLHA
jgi:hypothetical protein